MRLLPSVKKMEEWSRSPIYQKIAEDAWRKGIAVDIRAAADTRFQLLERRGRGWYLIAEARSLDELKEVADRYIYTD